VLGVLVASTIVYCTYALTFWRTNTATLLLYRFQSSARPRQSVLVLANLLGAHHWLERIAYPVVLYALGVSSTLHSLARPSYLLGHTYPHGTRFYFPITFLYKMPEGFLCLVAVLICLWIWRRTASAPAVEQLDRNRIFLLRAIAALFLVFSAAAVYSPLNLGIRHISVSIAALTILLGLIVPWSASMVSPRHRIGIGALVAMALVASCTTMLAVFPDYIGYVNHLKGSKPSYEFTVDINMGQSLIQIRNSMEEHKIQTIKFDAPGSVPELYLPSSQEFDCQAGLPANAAWLAVGANRFVITKDLKIDPAGLAPHCLELFKYPHWTNASGAFYIFQVGSPGTGPLR
jgi:hypothetical protein